MPGSPGWNGCTVRMNGLNTGDIVDDVEGLSVEMWTRTITAIFCGSAIHEPKNPWCFGWHQSKVDIK